jgi:hypothetical protein
MSEHPDDCQSFEDLLLQGGAASDLGAWQPHLETCAACRQQWIAHQMLAETFADERVPELSPDFATGLRHKLDTAVEIRPLAGWRMAAMLGYALLSAGLLGWIFIRLPLDLASPWTMAVAILAVPVTLSMVAGMTRWLPPIGRRRLPQLSLL